MRTLEVAILLLLLPVTLALFLPAPRRPRYIGYLPRLGAALIAVQLVLEGYRWQMLPAFVLTGIFLLASLITRAAPASLMDAARPSRWRTTGRVAAALAVLMVFGLAVVLPMLFPLFELPTPSGFARVGTTSFSLTDSSRLESFAPNESAHRQVWVQAWYPAQPTSSAKPQYLVPAQVAGRMTLSLGLPGIGFLLEHLALIRTHSYLDAAFSPARTNYPVLVFSHGYLGIPAQNTVQMEELASHGYIVFSIGHPYEAIALLYADGRIVSPSKDFLQKLQEYARRPGYAAKLFQLLASHDPDEQARLLQANSEEDPRFTHSLSIWSTDTRFLLDQLQKAKDVNSLQPFSGRMDLGRIGVFGMSFGGATAADVCLKDARCRAGINMDGEQFGEAARTSSTLNVPFMFMSDEPYSMLTDPVFRRATGPAWHITVKGSAHLNFTDMSLVSPLFRKLGVLGSIGAERMEQIMNAYLLAFFDENLEGRDSPLLHGPSVDYPEVNVQMHSGAGSAGNSSTPEG